MTRDIDREWGSDWDRHTYYRNMRSGNKSGSAIIDPASLNPFVWFDPSTIGTLFKDVAATIPVTADGDAVAHIRNRATGVDAAMQSLAAARPLYKVAGNVVWLEGDGVDDVLDDSSLTSPAQPFTIVSAHRILAYPATFSFLWGSSNNQEYGLAFTNAVMNVSADNFVDHLDVTVPAIGADFIAVQVFNGVSGDFRNYGVQTVTGNIGASALSNMDIFARADLNSANARFYGLVGVAGVLDNPTIDRLATYFQSKMP